MFGFSTAMKLMSEGKSVQRAVWGNETYYTITDKTIKCWGKFPENANESEMAVADILAKDWIVCPAD